MNPEAIDDYGLECLCIGIINQAASDYRDAWNFRARITQEDLDNAQMIVDTYDKATKQKEIKKAKELLDRESDAIITADTCRKFFNSDWYKRLTTVDGDYIIRKLDEELEAAYEFVESNRTRERAA